MEIYFRILLGFSFVLAALTVSVMLKMRNQSQKQRSKTKREFSLKALLGLGCIYCAAMILGVVMFFV